MESDNSTIDDLRRKNSKLHRRCQQAEAAIKDAHECIQTLSNGKPWCSGSLGRALLACEYRRLSDEITAKDATIRVLREALEGLYVAASEQQYTLASLGWKTEGGVKFSAAGARSHQFASVETALKSAVSVLEGKSSSLTLLRQLMDIREMARKTCLVGHSSGCTCWCCKVVEMCDAAANGGE